MKSYPAAKTNLREPEAGYRSIMLPMELSIPLVCRGFDLERSHRSQALGGIAVLTDLLSASRDFFLFFSVFSSCFLAFSSSFLAFFSSSFFAFSFCSAA